MSGIPVSYTHLVRVIDVDIPKARISLSMILDEKEAANRKYTKDNSNNKNNRNNGKGNRQDRKPKMCIRDSI